MKDSSIQNSPIKNNESVSHKTVYAAIGVILFIGILIKIF